MFGAIMRFRQRRRTVFHLSVLMYPVKQRQISKDLAGQLDRFVPAGLARGWNAPTTAAVIASAFMANMACQDLDLPRRERCLDQMRDHGPKDLVEELKWFVAVGQGEIVAADWDPFLYRFNFMNGLLAHWLIRENTIDIFTKSLFITLVTQAISGIDAQTMNERFDEICSQIGENASPSAVR
ncbi:hypothetical protein [Bosea psychrotolerans]|uniref:Uncharacterized protein n=1 Tax=Bosea psychrotolerans TaxID=1871628 RepID=A0A2S4M816_9HYPH|nr:hypothetical protein [Bosea psychrotolerans]POR50872.1 hypothetical protein CYD53_108120 [Bosea psychrotolerans]